MANVIRWDPFADVDFFRPRARRGLWNPRALAAWQEGSPGFAVDVSETEDEVEVRASLPGVEASEVDIALRDGVLTIKTEHKEASEDEQREYHRRELRYGAARRDIRLPARVDSDKARASLKDGVLSIRLPKAESLETKRIAIGA